MKRFTYGLLSTCILSLASWGPVAAVCEAAPPPAPAHRVEDQGEFFSSDAIARANEVVAKIKREHNKDLVIETYKELPLMGLSEEKAVEKFAARQFDRERVDGVYVLIAKKPHKYWVQVGKVTLTRAFTDSDMDKLKSLLKKDLIEGARKHEFDKVLLDSVNFVSNTIARNDPHPVVKAKNNTPVVTQEKPPNVMPPHEPGHAAVPQETNWVLWIVVGIVALLVLWIIMGMIRAATAPRGPGYGGGPGMAGGGGYGGGGYGGGGGGGFFSSLLGGMFGAAAGMWMYNNFFGGHSNFGGGGTTGYGGGNPAAGGGGDYQGSQSDVGAGSTGGGGDWGDDDKGGDQNGADAGGGGGGDWGGGGGDTGSGGGDWGGGGDTGGGGDWGGGGGGDFGGGGGGDWGGGGGGGGGDW